ncbi:MAG: sodium:proton antiporter [Aeromicrobium erythreum]
MDLLLLAVAGVLVIVTVTSVAGRIGVAAPLLLVVAGVGISFLPGVPAFEVPPEAILAGVLPPLLYAASVNMPALDFRRDFKAISGLSVVLVLVSALALGWLLPLVVPGIGFAEAFALGAIVSPTDAVATSIVRRTGVAPRLVTVLDGESMLNDATALVLLRTAVATTGASASLWHVGLDFLQAVLVAVAVGLLVAAVSLFVRSLVEDATVATSISFVVPFLAYAPAEHLGGSGLVAVVVAGLVTGTRGLVELRAEDRIAEEVNWRTIAFLLEGAVFLVMGLELRPLLADFDTSGQPWSQLAAVTAIALGVLLVGRAVWVALLLLELRRGRKAAGRHRPRLATFREYLTSDQAQQLSQRRRERALQAVAGARPTWSSTRSNGWADATGSSSCGPACVASSPSPPRRPCRRRRPSAACSCWPRSAWRDSPCSCRAARSRGWCAVWERSRTAPSSVAPRYVRCSTRSARWPTPAAPRWRRTGSTAVAWTRRRSSRCVAAVPPAAEWEWAGEDGPERDRRLRDFGLLRRAVLEDQREALLELRSEGRYDSRVLDTVLGRLDVAETAAVRRPPT